jgi:hypothetical protein
MLAHSAMEGKTAFAAFQGGLFALNAGEVSYPSGRKTSASRMGS